MKIAVRLLRQVPTAVATATTLLAVGCAKPNNSAGTYPTTHFETPDLTILEPKIPADVTVEGGVPLVTAVGAEGRHVVGIVAQPIPKPELSADEQKLLGIDPNHKSYYEKLLALYKHPMTPAEGVNPWCRGAEVQSAGIGGEYHAIGSAASVTTVGPRYAFESPMMGPNAPASVGAAAAPVQYVGNSGGAAQTAENEPKPRAVSRERVRP